MILQLVAKLPLAMSAKLYGGLFIKNEPIKTNIVNALCNEYIIVKDGFYYRIGQIYLEKYDAIDSNRCNAGL